MPLISVIIPVYNAEKFLTKCVNSVLSQTFQDFELILVDDGSLDGSGPLCDNFAIIDKRVKTIHKTNGGVSSARNLGIKNSIGKWISFIDSDDWVENDYLANFKVNDSCEKKSIIMQGIVMDSRNKANFSNLFSYLDDFFEMKDMLKIYDADLLKDGCPVAKLFNRDVIEERNLLFDENLSLNEDHVFVLTYFLEVDFVYTRSGMKYHYLFDYTTPSLTKIKHSVAENLLASETIYNVVQNLCAKLECDIQQLASKETMRIFGFQQIMRAFRGTSFCRNQFEECCSYWRKNLFVQCECSDLHEKILFFLLKYKLSFVAFVWNVLVSFFKSEWLTMKRKIKKLLNF